ncbi:MAG: hypothetical protein N2035_08900 [Chthoniobacterales bacterium]|nr:hypothetical protein [Chthoniobacterales bacterium]
MTVTGAAASGTHQLHAHSWSSSPQAAIPSPCDRPQSPPSLRCLLQLDRHVVGILRPGFPCPWPRTTRFHWLQHARPSSHVLGGIFGLEPHPATGSVTRHIHLTKALGVENFPFGIEATRHFRCAARGHPTDESQVGISSSLPIHVRILWPGGEKQVSIPKS